MDPIFKKLKNSLSLYYYGQKNDWHFPSNIAHSSGSKMAKGNYEPFVSKKVAAHLNVGDTFIDVGANIGYFSRIAADLVGPNGAVYAFEVDLENYYALSKNTESYSNINALHFAVSNNNSFAKVNHSFHSACHSLLNTQNLLDGKKFNISTMTLDHFWKFFLEKKPIQLLKIDVEGAERMVLNGMDELLATNMITTMIVEFCPAIFKGSGGNVAEFYHKITKDFIVSIIEKQYRSVVKNGKIDTVSGLQTVSRHLLQKDGAVNINLLCQR